MDRAAFTGTTARTLRPPCLSGAPPSRHTALGGTFASVEDVEAKVVAFIDYSNQTLAKPVTWTDQGKPQGA